MTKQERYSELVEGRKRCRRCAGLINPAACCGGRYDTDEIGPWSRWQGNLDASVMVIGQDWADEAAFIHDQGRDPEGNPTNETLMRLLEAIGVRISGPLAEKPDRGAAFFTNAILCLKRGGMQAEVSDEWFANCGAAFLFLLIELIRPRVVITLGERAYEVLQSGFRLPRLRLRQAVEHPEGWEIMEGVRLFPRYHCGRRTQNINRSFDQQLKDWLRIKPFLLGQSPEAGGAYSD